MFQVDDIIRSKKSGKFYTVTKVINNGYIEHNESTKPQFAGQYEKVSEKWVGHTPFASVSQSCKEGFEHKWVDIGFRFTKYVCYHCDKEQPQPPKPVVWGGWRMK